MESDGTTSGWTASAKVLCHGWFTKRRISGNGWWERYFVLCQGGLLGWYQQPPSDIERPGLPRRWVYLLGASVEWQEFPPAAGNFGPCYVLEICEAVKLDRAGVGGEGVPAVIDVSSEEGCLPSDPSLQVPALALGSDDRAATETWFREILTASRHRVAPQDFALRVLWQARKGDFLSEGTLEGVARGTASAGESIAQLSHRAGVAAERVCALVGHRAGARAAWLFGLPDEEAAVLVGEKVALLMPALIGVVAQLGGLVLTVAGHYAGGARRPSFSTVCRRPGAEAIPVPLPAAPVEAALLRLLPCDGCGIMPISRAGCPRCGLCFCTVCFSAHTQPPIAHLMEDEERRTRTETAYDKRISAKMAQQYVRSQERLLERLLEARQAFHAETAPAPVALCSTPPRHWVSWNVPPEGGWTVQLLQDRILLRGLQACLATRSQDLNVGRDVTIRPAYDRLELAHAWRLEHHDLWAQYVHALRQVRSQSSIASIPHLNMRNEVDSLRDKLQDWAVCVGSALDSSVNEKLCAHGTKPETLASILANGLNERYCGGAFGHGVYLAEDCGKCDQYTTADNDEGGTMRPELHRLLFQACGLPHAAGLHYLLICRAALGRAAHTLDGETEQTTCETVWAGTEKRELAPIPGTDPPLPYHSLIVETGRIIKRYREVIIFHSARIYPEYLIAYHRR